MGGMGLAGGLSQLGLIAAGGPIGIGLAALGAVFGMNSARKAAEEQAQRLREQMLDQLRKINNALKPVSDYFNRGGFGALAPAQVYGGGQEIGWAIQSRRGRL